MSAFQNKFIVDDLNYDKQELAELHVSLLKMLTKEQLRVYNDVINAVLSESGQFFFLYGYGGTGKAFLWKTLSAGLRSQGMIVLNVVSSGIVALLLPGGRIDHSTFFIPLVIIEESTCNIAQGSFCAKLLIETKLIIWDEVPMMNRCCFEAFDRTLRDLMKIKCEDSKDKPFGGKVVILGSDFRQILPVVRKRSREEVFKATINSSTLWKHCKVLKLTQNMRLNCPTSVQTSYDVKQFADWIIQLGDGDMDSNVNGETGIDIPEDFFIQHGEKPLLSLVEFVYPNILQNMHTVNFFEQ